MTALCPGGGASSANTGAAAIVDYSSGLLAAIFAAYDLTWLIPIIPLVGLAPLTLSTFCATDPPTVPTFTSAETNAMIQLQFGSDFDSGISKMKDLALNAIWHDVCHCNTGVATPLAPPTPPAGTPITQFPVAPTSTPCAAIGPIVHGFTGGNGTFNRGDLSWPGGMAPSYGRLTVKNTVTAGVGWTMQTQPRWGSGTGQVDLPIQRTAPNTTSVGVYPFVSGPVSTSFAVTTIGVGGTGSADESLTWEVFCNGATPGQQSPCCPPDPATQSYLDHILSMVTLIQRQIVPFAYVPGTVHAGLSGAGVLSVNGLLGAKIVITTDPSSLGVEGTSPAELFGRGFITWGTPDGYPQSERLQRTSQISLPLRCSAFTDLAYDLHPGVVVTITELVREP